MRSGAKMALSFVAGAALASLLAARLRTRDVRIETATRAAAQPPALNPEADRSPQVARPGAPVPAREDSALRQAGGPGPSDGPERERLQREQIATLQARVRVLEQREVPKRDPDDEAPQRKKFHDYTDAELQAMARNCEVRFDLPRIAREPYQLPPDLGARMHLSDAEQQRVGAAVDKASEDVVAHLRALYLEATGDASGADALDPQSLMREILDKSPPAAVQAARAEIARERAGLPPAPSGTIAERYLRYMTSVGDSLQSALEPALGAQHAAAVRDALGESRSSMSGCPH